MTDLEKKIKEAIYMTVDGTLLNVNELGYLADSLSNINTAGFLSRDGIDEVLKLIYKSPGEYVNSYNGIHNFFLELRYNLRFLGISRDILVEIYNIYVDHFRNSFLDDAVKQVYLDLPDHNYDTSRTSQEDILLTVIFILRLKIQYFNMAILNRNSRENLTTQQRNTHEQN